MPSSSGILYALYPTTVMKAPLPVCPLSNTSQVTGWRRFSRCRSSLGDRQFAEGSDEFCCIFTIPHHQVACSGFLNLLSSHMFRQKSASREPRFWAAMDRWSRWERRLRYRWSFFKMRRNLLLLLYPGCFSNSDFDDLNDSMNQYSWCRGVSPVSSRTWRARRNTNRKNWFAAPQLSEWWWRAFGWWEWPKSVFLASVRAYHGKIKRDSFPLGDFKDG